MDKRLFFISVSIFLAGFGICRGMSSENYLINSDVVGTGGDIGTSERYKLTDTLGQPVIGIGQGGSYAVQQGFWYTVNYSLSLSIGSTVVDLGSFAPGNPTTGQSTLGVTTDSWGGYDLFVRQNHDMTHTDSVTTIPAYAGTISSPTSWSGVGLGFTITSGTDVEAKWGSNPNYNYAGFPGSDTKIHEKSGYTSWEDDTVIGYKVDAASSQKSGTYSNIITYTAMTKL
jgi:hypothetical protein